MNDYPKKIGENKWIIEIRGQGGSDELYIELPPQALHQMGWDAGDTIIWEEQENGSYLLRKKDE